MYFLIVMCQNGWTHHHTSAYDSPIILVFPVLNIFQTGSPAMGLFNTDAVHEFCDYLLNRHHGCHNCFFPREKTVPMKFIWSDASSGCSDYGEDTNTDVSCISFPWKTIPCEIYACGSGHHHRCPICVLPHKKIFALKIYCCYFVCAADAQSVSDSKVSCFVWLNGVNQSHVCISVRDVTIMNHIYWLFDIVVWTS